MKLTNRLQAIADLITEDVVVGDIGSDHGYLMAYLVENKVISQGIASDINDGPVKNCQDTIRAHGLHKKISVRLGGGLEPYKPGEIHTAVIAGMGGQLIRDIISNSFIAHTVECFILQPMTGQEVLRKWLIHNGYNIEQEVIANEQDRYYEIMVVKQGEKKYEQKDWMKHMQLDEPLTYEIGIQMTLSDAYEGFINKKIQKYETIRNNIETHQSTSSKLEEVKANLNKLNEVMACIQTLKR